MERWALLRTAPAHIVEALKRRTEGESEANGANSGLNMLANALPPALPADAAEQQQQDSEKNSGESEFSSPPQAGSPSPSLLRTVAAPTSTLYNKSFTIGSKKRRKASKQQVALLEKHYVINQFPDKDERAAIAAETDLSLNQVQNWFQNKRAKLRRIERNEKLTVAQPQPTRPLLPPLPAEVQQQQAQIQQIQQIQHQQQQAQIQQQQAQKATRAQDEDLPIRSYSQHEFVAPVDLAAVGEMQLDFSPFGSLSNLLPRIVPDSTRDRERALSSDRLALPFGSSSSFSNLKLPPPPENVPRAASPSIASPFSLSNIFSFSTYNMQTAPQTDRNAESEWRREHRTLPDIKFNAGPELQRSTSLPEIRRSSIN